MAEKEMEVEVAENVVAETAPVAEKEAKTSKPRKVKEASETEQQGTHRPRKMMGRRKVCQFCVDHVEHIDYKDVAKIRRYIAENGKIISRRQTGTCAKHQREITTAIKRARYMGLIYYKGE